MEADCVGAEGWDATVLRAIDEEIAALRDLQRAIPEKWRNASSWNRYQGKIESLAALRGGERP